MFHKTVTAGDRQVNLAQRHQLRHVMWPDDFHLQPANAGDGAPSTLRVVVPSEREAGIGERLHSVPLLVPIRYGESEVGARRTISVQLR